MPLGKFSRAVILSDSRAALLAIVSDKNSISQDILDCQLYLQNLASLEKTVLQCVPAHCGITHNEKADFLAKKGALVMQNTFHPLPLHTVRDLIKRSIKVRAQKDLYHRVSHKSWKNAIPNLYNGPRRRAVLNSTLPPDMIAYNIIFINSKLFLLRYVLCAALER
ncbi:uncharacterized protein LOC118204154 [Stegodyphus dumicola]|uniref:uncharacterized protein LOC118204154 n=1 Tax=Stegodyphus dumicola TaxID=202533 RepID=UPI0015AB4373|nr:uncharacterized protein LOC118204154 [Stegodyphus dumicola]